MKTLQRFIFLIIFYSFLSCDNKENELVFEKNVMVEIFPSLIDSLWIQTTIIQTPPPAILKEENKFVSHSKRDIKKLKTKLNIELAQYKKEKSKIIAVISDTIDQIGHSNTKELLEHFKITKTEISKVYDSSKYVIERKRIAYFPNLRVIYFSKNYKENKKWEYFDRLKIHGTISFSRILFSNTKKQGILTVCVNSYASGNGFKIFIQKVNNKWIIDKIEHSWLS